MLFKVAPLSESFRADFADVRLFTGVVTAMVNKSPFISTNFPSRFIGTEELGLLPLSLRIEYFKKFKGET